MIILLGGRQCGDCYCSICPCLWVQCFSIAYCKYNWILYSPYWRVLEMVSLSSHLTYCSLHNKDLVVKLKIPHFECFLLLQWLLLCSLTFVILWGILKDTSRNHKSSDLVNEKAIFSCLLLLLPKQCKHCRELFVMRIVALHCWQHETFSCNWTCVQMIVSKHVLHTDVNLGSQATKWAQ